jgi:hypothetical protein
MTQGVSVLISLLLWHGYLFRKRDGSAMFISKKDRASDETFIFALPIICLIAPVFNVNVDVIDIIQALVVYGMIYIWRAYMYRHAINR